MALIFAASTVIAYPVQATATYDLTGTWTWNYYFGSNTYTHEMRITSFDVDSGIFTGDGEYIAGPGWVPGYTWTLVGLVVDTTITFDIVYTGIDSGYTVAATGEIAQNGFFMSGDATGTPTQTATWDAELNIIQLTFPLGSTAEALIEIIPDNELPGCATGIYGATPYVRIEIISGEFDGTVKVCIRYDDTGMTLSQEKKLRLYRFDCIDVDFNDDDTINGEDLSLIKKHIKTIDPTPADVERFDVNNDLIVDDADVAIVKEYMTKGLIVNQGRDGESQVRLPWLDITLSVDPDLNILCGETDHFSIFRGR